MIEFDMPQDRAKYLMLSFSNISAKKLEHSPVHKIKIRRTYWEQCTRDEFDRLRDQDAKEKELRRKEEEHRRQKEEVVNAAGKLVLQIIYPMNAEPKDVELFIDGELNRTFRNSAELRECVLDLPAALHTVALKKQGIEAYSQTVEVKRLSEGKTFLQINMIVTGTVLVKNKTPFGRGVRAYVMVDKDSSTRKDWPAGRDSIEVTAEIGTRVIGVYIQAPGTSKEQEIRSFTLRVMPGKQTVVNIADAEDKATDRKKVEDALKLREEAAASRLEYAKNVVLTQDGKQACIEKLDELIKNYQGTKACEEAKELRKTLKMK